MALAAAMPGIYIDAKPDREMPAGLAILHRLAATGRLRPVVVIGLGTNYIVTTRQLNEVIKILGPDRKLVLSTLMFPMRGVSRSTPRKQPLYTSIRA